jgi:hypothetical protein
MKAYLESTIFNRYFEEGQEFAGETRLMFERIAAGKIIAYTSVAVLEELEKAPDLKRARMMGLINKYKITTLEVHEIAYKLADAYVENEIMPLKHRLNGVHIAMAAVFDLDCIISLDFHHINKWKTKAETEVVNRKNGFSHILICTPGEVIYEDE